MVDILRIQLSCMIIMLYWIKKVLRLTNKSLKCAGSNEFDFKQSIFKHRLKIEDIEHLPIRVFMNSNIIDSVPNQMLD